MAFSREDIQTLESAIAAGAKVVRMDGREFEYQSIDKMRDALLAIKSEVLAAESAVAKQSRKPRIYRARTGSGY